MLTMLLGGLWHGAALHFIFWGAYHGVLLIVARSAPRSVEHAATWATRLRQIGCFHLIVFGWLLFRVQDMHTFVDYLQGFARLTGGTQLSGLFYAVLAGTAISHVVSARLIESCTQWLLARTRSCAGGTLRDSLVAFLWPYIRGALLLFIFSSEVVQA